MTEIWIKPEHVFDGADLREGVGLRIADGLVAEIAAAPSGARKLRGCVTPGFVDLQVNGGGGVMLNSTPTRAGVLAIAEAHRRFGTVAILPTVITDAPEVLEAAASAVLDCRTDAGILGLHIEGPHIAPARRGTHDARFIRPLDPRTITVVETLRQHGVAVMITLAPEAATLHQIRTLAAMGAVVSLGHTDADADLVEAAIEAGAGCATHLFNAMSPMTSRAPGAVGAILGSAIPAGLICDGHHVDDRMIRLALRAKVLPDSLFLVSDSMATVGGPDTFELYGQTVHLRDGRLVNQEGSLAGAHITQAEGVRRLVGQIGRPLQEALRMAITTPAGVMGQPEMARLEGRALRDVLVLGQDATVERTLADMLAPAGVTDAAE